MQEGKPPAQVVGARPAGVARVRDQCCNIVTGLAIWRQEAASLAVIERLIGAPDEYHRDLGRVIFDLSAWFLEEDEEIRQQAFGLLERILDALLAAARAMDATLGGRPFDTLPKEEQERYGEFLKNIDEIAMRLYLNSGAVRGNPPVDIINWRNRSWRSSPRWAIRTRPTQ